VNKNMFKKILNKRMRLNKGKSRKRAEVTAAFCRVTEILALIFC
jgi:hypothetical protein